MSDTDRTQTRLVTLETGASDRFHPGSGAAIAGFDRLDIEAAEDGRGVVIDLSDRGAGLPAPTGGSG